MTSEEKLLIAKCEDLFRLCDRYADCRFSDFLNEAEQAFIQREIGQRLGDNTQFFGGFSDAQRKIFGVFPEWMEISYDVFPIGVVKISKKYKKVLSHRDYLGTVLSTGLDRVKIGDIIVNEDGAYIITREEVSDFVARNIEKISNVGVKTELCSISEIDVPKQEFLVIDAVCASVRLDAVISGVLNISRRVASELILTGKVSVNYLETNDTSKQLKPDDVVSVRGFGKFIFSRIGNITRSERVHIEVRKFM